MRLMRIMGLMGLRPVLTLGAGIRSMWFQQSMNLENPTNAGASFGKDISARVFRNCLVYLFLLGLIARTGFMVEHARTPSFGVLTLDQKYYDRAARMLLAGEDLHQLHGLR